MDYKLNEVYSQGIPTSFSIEDSDKVEKPELNEFLLSFVDENDVIPEEIIDYFNLNFAKGHIKTSIDSNSTYFPTALVRSISILLNSQEINDSILRKYIFSASKLASLSEQFSFHLIDMGILSIFIQVICSKFTMSKSHAFVAINNMIVSETMIDHINQNCDFFANLIDLTHHFSDAGNFNLPLRILSNLCQYRTSLQIMPFACASFIKNLQNGNDVSKQDAAIGLEHLISTYPESLEQAVEMGIIGYAFNFLSNLKLVKFAFKILLTVLCSDYANQINLDFLAEKLVYMINTLSPSATYALEFLFSLIQINQIYLSIFNDNDLIKEICQTSISQKFNIRKICANIICFVILNSNVETIVRFLQNKAFENITLLIDEEEEEISCTILESIIHLLNIVPDYPFMMDSVFIDNLKSYADSIYMGAENAEIILNKLGIE